VIERRAALLGLGGLIFLVGLAVAFLDPVAALVPTEALVAAAGHDYFLAAAVGALALAAGTIVFTARAMDGFDRARPPRAEEVPLGTPPGADIDTVLAGELSAIEHVVGETRDRVRHRLRRTAVETLVRTGDVSRSEAERTVDRGSWTEDRRAARFLMETDREPLSARAVDALPGGSRFQRDVRHACEAIFRLADEGPTRAQDRTRPAGDGTQPVGRRARRSDEGGDRR